MIRSGPSDADDVAGSDEKGVDEMLPAILILLVIAILFGVGLAVAKFLLWVAAILFVIWVIGWFVGAGAAAGANRRWYSW